MAISERLPEGEREKWVHDMHLFSELIRTPGWDRHRGYMEKREVELMEDLIQTGSAIEFTRGYIQGLRFAVAHPQIVIDRMKERA